MDMFTSYGHMILAWASPFNIRKYLIAFSKFRCSNHQLAIEQGRHSEILMADRIMCFV